MSLTTHSPTNIRKKREAIARKCMRYRQTNQPVAPRQRGQEITPAEERAAGRISPEDKAERVLAMTTSNCKGMQPMAEAMRLPLHQAASNAVTNGMRNATAPFSVALRLDRYVGDAILKDTTITNNVRLDS